MAAALRPDTVPRVDEIRRNCSALLSHDHYDDDDDDEDDYDDDDDSVIGISTVTVCVHFFSLSRF